MEGPQVSIWTLKRGWKRPRSPNDSELSVIRLGIYYPNEEEVPSLERPPRPSVVYGWLVMQQDGLVCRAMPLSGSDEAEEPDWRPSGSQF